jgi:5'-3' exoribonuclease 2
MRRVQQILSALAAREAGIFKKRKEVSDKQAANRARREAQTNANKRQRTDGPPGFKRAKETTDTYTSQGIVFFDPKEAQSKAVRDVHRDIAHVRDPESNKSAAQKLKELMKAKADGTSVPASETPAEETEPASESASDAITPVHLGKRKVDELEDADNGTPGRNTPVVPASPAQAAPTPQEGETDTVMLWEDGYEGKAPTTNLRDSRGVKQLVRAFEKGNQRRFKKMKLTSSERYYEQKFHVKPDDIAFRHKVARQYAEGLCWVLSYYMHGCPSWTWYFPHHYAPFAADFVGLEDMDPRKLFEKGTPFHPYGRTPVRTACETYTDFELEQLMGVLPAASNHAIPSPFRVLMQEPSPIADFYPEDWALDLNGKKWASTRYEYC